MIKLIATDMDGTLLKDDKEIDKEIYQLLPKMKKENIHFVAASGRQRPSLEKLFEGYLNDVTILAENGAYIVHNGEEIYASVMTRELIDFITTEIRKLDNVGILYCGRHCCYTPDMQCYEILASPKFHYNIKLINNFDEIKEEIIKISLVDPQGASGYSFPILEKILKGKVEIAVSGFDCVDIVNKGVSKGNAIEILQKMWNITSNETMTFGDNYNDVEMLQCAKYSFAMQHSEEGVKKYANYVAGDNNKGAVVAQIKKFVNI
ncbi:Cof-type HAD-IIB family hydrolase [Clostridium sp. MD294]|uniref:Cof-type HAD-IIB family hydrolase n=1 Tax=Clostridium sp. MD294 TaxID=97138 RepID=UPI0002C970D7|nr:Cof-type HAD-IIB family hydrolase [Clostridium sp. MD294]NDO47351.1 Cof-type HAD-IIB family hydrolase [Clostridium sp. MD294]USF29580.1 5-amino-6-(5-phospho-D-ribitylamino)uracil phosphatase YbjI [Clostridium sp. MD294]